MSKIDKILEKVKLTSGLEIKNNSMNEVPLFDVAFHQPFKFNIEIAYNEIKGNCEFQLHFPSLYIKGNEIDDFTKEIRYVTNIINCLNNVLKIDYNNSEWIKK